MTQETYTGPSGGLKKDSPWLASEDIGTGEKRVLIEDVTLHKNVKFDKGRTEEKLGALKLGGIEKRMVLNATNRKKLVKLYGMDTKEWRGKWVTLWVDTNVKMAGEIVNGLRIKETSQEQERQSQNDAPFDLQLLTDIGDTKAGQGMTTLREWWATLPAKAKSALATKKDGEWKQTAEAV